MNIFHVVPSFGFGGMEKIICSIINNTSEKYNHNILSLDRCDDALEWIKRADTNIIHFSKHKNNVVFFREFFKYLKYKDIDLLMTYNWGSTDAIWLGRLSGVKNIIHSEHGFNIDEATYTSLKRRMIRFLVYHMASRVIVVSRELTDMMKKMYFLNESRISFIPNGIDTSYYSQDIMQRAQTRQELDLRDSDFVIGFSGRLDPIKNFNLMLDIFTKCINNNQNFKLLIVGDGPERKHIESLCLQRNICKHVRLVGQKQHVIPYLRAMDVFLLTSLREQMPLTVLEAMSVGLPVISTNVGEISRMIDSGTDGFIRDADDEPENFADALLVLTDRKKRDRLGESARRKIVTGFQERVMLQKYETIMHDILV
jgi:glycosyltransferase involved in cell wall biosynthesis